MINKKRNYKLILKNTKIVGDDVLDKTWHMVFTTKGFALVEI